MTANEHADGSSIVDSLSAADQVMLQIPEQPAMVESPARTVQRRAPETFDYAAGQWREPKQVVLYEVDRRSSTVPEATSTQVVDQIGLERERAVDKKLARGPNWKSKIIASRPHEIPIEAKQPPLLPKGTFGVEVEQLLTNLDRLGSRHGGSELELKRTQSIEQFLGQHTSLETLRSLQHFLQGQTQFVRYSYWNKGRRTDDQAAELALKLVDQKILRSEGTQRLEALKGEHGLRDPREKPPHERVHELVQKFSPFDRPHFHTVLLRIHQRRFSQADLLREWRELDQGDTATFRDLFEYLAHESHPHLPLNSYAGSAGDLRADLVNLLVDEVQGELAKRQGAEQYQPLKTDQLPAHDRWLRDELETQHKLDWYLAKRQELLGR